MPEPGDVVTVDFVGATGVKRRPAVVVSSRLYHAHRPDLILAVLTTQVTTVTAPTDYVLQDWAAAGLRRPLAFCAYLDMATPAADEAPASDQRPDDLHDDAELIAIG